MPVARTPPQGGPHSPYSPPTPTLNDQAGRHAKSDNPDDIKVPKFSVGESVGRDSFDARFIRGQVSMGQRSVFEQAPLSGPFTPPATAQQDRTCHLISAATFLNYILPEFLPDSLERSQHKRKANIDKSVDITAGDDTSLRQVRPSSIALLKDMLLKEAMSKEFVPVDVSVESPKSQSWSEVIRGPMPYAVRRDESFEHNRPAFPRQIVDMASFSTDTSFDNIPPSPFTSLSNARVLHHRPSSGMQLLRSATSLWTFIIILASIFPTAQASPLTYAEGSLSTVSGTPIGLYVACAIPVAVGIIGYIMTLFYKLFGPSWRNCLGVLSLMASIVWTCLVHWDKAPDLRKFVLALCHGLISNFTLQLCMSRRRKLLPEAWAINLGFPLAALLLRFLDALPIVAPNGEEMPALPSSITDLIWSGFLRWATSPLQFTSWAILVKVAFYTCDVIINRHDPQPPTTLWGRFVKRIACSAEELPGRFLRINQEGRANQGAAIANGHHAGVPDNGVELNNLFPDMNPAQTAVE